MSERRSPIALSTKLYYGVGAVAYGVKDNGFAFLLLLYYNQVLGLPEAWVGFGIMIALAIDALSDPVVGYLSDHLHSRWGRRHPFMYAAALPVAVSYYLLFNPPRSLHGAALFAYFVVIAVAVRTFITCYEIPSTSLVAELSDDYDQRTSMLSYRFFFGWWGGLGMSVAAYAVFLQPDAERAVGVLNADGYRSYGLAAALVILAAVLVSSLGTHRHIPHLRQPPPRGAPGARHALGEVLETLTDESFRALFIAGIFWAMAAGVSAALGIYFNTYFWELSSDQISLLVLANFPAAAVALIAAPALSRRLGKKRAALRLGAIALVLAPLGVFARLLGWMPENGSPALLPLLIAGSMVEVSLVITTSILVSAMVADVVEQNELQTGRRSEGVLFAARSFVQKAVSGVGIFVSTLMLGLIGFPRGAEPGAVDPAVVRNLGLVYVPILLVLNGAGLAMISRYRISRERHEENLRRLADQEAAL